MRPLFRSFWIVAIASLRVQADVHFQMLSAPPTVGVSRPVASLIRGSDGALYGVGDYIFKLQPDGSGFRQLCNCGAGPTAYSPQGALLEASDGRLYSLTLEEVFSIRKDGNDYRAVYSFGSDAADSSILPNGGLVEGPDGQLYFTSQSGGSTNLNIWGGTGNGTICKLKKDGTGFQIFHRFAATPDDGQQPVAGLLLASDGWLYGLTPVGGTNDSGIIYSLRIDGTDYRILHHFGLLPDGAHPQGPLIQGRDGALYGTTSWGGASVNTNYSWQGTVFKINTDGSDYRVLHSFGKVDDGFWPYSALLQTPDGALYGTTLLYAYLGDDGIPRAGSGSVFRLNSDGSNYSVLHHFDIGEDAILPMAGLVEGREGALYGTGAGNSIGGYADGGVYSGSLFKLWPPETPEVKVVTASNNQARVRLAGSSGEPYQLFRSTNLVDWNVLTNVVMPAVGAFLFPDQAPAEARTFYRAAWSR